MSDDEAEGTFSGLPTPEQAFVEFRVRIYYDRGEPAPSEDAVMAALRSHVLWVKDVTRVEGE